MDKFSWTLILNLLICWEKSIFFKIQQE
jgi:hypothetical protein